MHQPPPGTPGSAAAEQARLSLTLGMLTPDRLPTASQPGGRQSGELIGPLPRCGAGGASGQKGCGWCGQRPGWASAWRQTAVSAVTSGTLMELLSGRALPAGRNGRRTRCVYLLEGLFPGRLCPARGGRLGDGLVPAASLMRVPGMGPAGRLAMAKARPGAAAQFWRRRRGSLRRRRTTRGWRLTASLLVSSTGLTPARSPRGWLPMRR